jgi:hypothetical protein
VKLKIRKPVPEGDGLDGLTWAAHLISKGDPTFAIVRLEAVHTEVAPEGDELAVVATITAGEALTSEALHTRALELYDIANAERTGAEHLEYDDED